MARRTSSSAQALLGLLTIEPMSGYDLGQMVRASTGHMWSESYGQIYPNLKKLAADGLVVCKTDRQKKKPDRNIYSITKKGRQHLQEWLAVPPQPEIPRNELLLKLFFGSQVPAHILIAYVERMVEHHRFLLEKFKRTEREDIAQNRQYPDAPFWKMTARYGQMEMVAHLAWAEETLRALRRLEKQQTNPSKAHKEKKYAGK